MRLEIGEGISNFYLQLGLGEIFGGVGVHLTISINCLINRILVIRLFEIIRRKKMDYLLTHLPQISMCLAFISLFAYAFVWFVDGGEHVEGKLLPWQKFGWTPAACFILFAAIAKYMGF